MISVKPLEGNLINIATMLVVSNLEKSTDFYTTTFGFTIKEKQEDIVLLSYDSMLLYLIPKSPPTPDKPDMNLDITNSSNRTSVNMVFRVKNCQQAYEHLTAKGLLFLAPPQSPPWGGLRCFAKDPEGYLIEIEQP